MTVWAVGAIIAAIIFGTLSAYIVQSLFADGLGHGPLSFAIAFVAFPAGLAVVFVVLAIRIARDGGL